MEREARPCPICGEALDTPMRIDVCGTCYLDMSASGQVALQATAEFEAMTPARAEHLMSAGRAKKSTGGPDVACTWCGKSRGSVKKMLANGPAHICNECVALCADILEAELGEGWR